MEENDMKLRELLNGVPVASCAVDLEMEIAGVRHLPEEPLDLKGFRRGAVRRDDLLPDHVLIGTDKAHLGLPCLL